MFNGLEMVVAFGSGAFAAAIGALPAFIMCGVLVVANLPDLAFGYYFGPHVSFAAGVGAAAFASARNKDINGKDIALPLIKFNNPGMLLVGGLFGLGGYLCQKVLGGIGTPTDTIALTVALSGIAARVIFGKSGVFHAYTLPNSKEALSIILVGLGVGLLAGYTALVTKNVVLGFGVAAITLMLPQFMGGIGVATHHVALPAALAAAATGNLYIGAAFGIAGALMGDFFGKTLNSGDTHIDPPATVIAILTTVVLLFLK